jgi:hypothetical protein
MGGVFGFVRDMLSAGKERKLEEEAEGKALTDPVFGELVFHNRRWEGKCALGSQGEVRLRVVTRMAAPPSEKQRQAFQALLADVEARLRAAVEATFRYYEDGLRADDHYPGLPAFGDGAAFCSILKDTRLFVGPERDGAWTNLEWGHDYPGKPKLRGFRYSVDFQPDGTAKALLIVEQMWDPD